MRDIMSNVYDAIDSSLRLSGPQTFEPFMPVDLKAAHELPYSLRIGVAERFQLCHCTGSNGRR
jgi:hypothetical protein